MQRHALHVRNLEKLFFNLTTTLIEAAYHVQNSSKRNRVHLRPYKPFSFKALFKYDGGVLAELRKGKKKEKRKMKERDSACDVIKSGDGGRGNSHMYS